MRIAFVVGVFPKLSETFVLNQITGLLDLGHHVHVVAFRRSDESVVHPLVTKYRLLERTSYVEIPQGRFRRLAKTLRMLLFHSPGRLGVMARASGAGRSVDEAINNLFKLPPFLGQEYDVVHCHFGPNGNEMAFLKDIWPQLRLFVTFHGYDIKLGLEEGGGIYRRLFANCDGVFAIGGYNRASLERLGCPANKIIDHSNGIDTDEFKLTREKRSSSPPVVLTVARFVDEKDIPLALAIVKSLEGAPFVYRLVGDGPLRPAIESRILELGLENVELLGSMPAGALREQLEHADVFLLTSKSEVFGVVLVEAQAMEVPVVAADVGGVRDALDDGRTGFLFPHGDFAAGGSRVRQLLQDPELRRRMGKDGRAFVVERFDIKRLNLKLEQTYSRPVTSSAAK